MRYDHQDYSYTKQQFETFTQNASQLLIVPSPVVVSDNGSDGHIITYIDGCKYVPDIHDDRIGHHSAFSEESEKLVVIAHAHQAECYVPHVFGTAVCAGVDKNPFFELYAGNAQLTFFTAILKIP